MCGYDPWCEEVELNEAEVKDSCTKCGRDADTLYANPKHGYICSSCVEVYLKEIKRISKCLNTK